MSRQELLQSMAKQIFSISPEMQASWDYVMGQMLSFVNDTGADVDLAYDFVCEQLGIDSFVYNDKAWDDFYTCLLYTSPSPRDRQKSRMPSSA